MHSTQRACVCILILCVFCESKSSEIKSRYFYDILHLQIFASTRTLKCNSLFHSRFVNERVISSGPDCITRSISLYNNNYVPYQNLFTILFIIFQNTDSYNGATSLWASTRRQIVNTWSMQSARLRREPGLTRIITANRTQEFMQMEQTDARWPPTRRTPTTDQQTSRVFRNRL